MPEYLLILDGSKPPVVPVSGELADESSHFPTRWNKFAHGNFVHLGLWNARSTLWWWCSTLAFLMPFEPRAMNCSMTNWGRSTVDSIGYHWDNRFNTHQHTIALNILELIGSERTFCIHPILFSKVSKGLHRAPSTTTQARIVLHIDAMTAKPTKF